MAWKYENVEVCDKNGNEFFTNVFITTNDDGGNEPESFVVVSIQDAETGEEIDVYDNELDGIIEHLSQIRKVNPGVWVENMKQE